MGLLRGPQRHRLFVALVVAAALGLPATARGVPPKAAGPGPLTGFTVRGNTVELAALTSRVQVVFYTDDVFRIWMAPDGAFTDPANAPPDRDGAPAADVVVKHDYPGVSPRVTDAGPYYLLQTRSLSLRAYKARLRFALYQPDDTSLIWEDAWLSAAIITPCRSAAATTASTTVCGRQP